MSDTATRQQQGKKELFDFNMESLARSAITTRGGVWGVDGCPFRLPLTRWDRRGWPLAVSSGLAQPSVYAPRHPCIKEPPP